MKYSRRCLVAMVLLLGTAKTVPAGPDPTPLPAGLEPATAGQVSRIVDGDTVVLADGREIRMVGLQAPKLPLGRAGFEAWPLAAEAKAALGDLILGRKVRLAYGGRRSDRYGRKLAHVVRSSDGLWVQAAMLRRGMARVYSFADNRAALRRLQAIETDARADGTGIWDHPYYRIRTVSEAHNEIGSFQVVMGRVRETADVRGRVFLNFGQDWRTDFTVSIPPDATALFETAGIDPLTYKGRWIRVRGWIESYNGPMIEATHPEQIEVVK